MIRMTVGGRALEIDADDVKRLMRSVPPETIREHLVELNGSVYPPKQVLAEVTGWERQTFTTMEAQRVLTRLGFVCRRAGDAGDGRRAWIREQPDNVAPDLERRVAVLETELAVIKEAVAGLSARIN